MCDNGRTAQNVQNLTKRQRLFVEWLATSKYDRIPPTQRILAGDLGVHERTLSRWKKIPGLDDLVVATAKGFIHDRLPEIYAALAREAEAGSFQHIKLALELTGEHLDKSSVDVTTKGESLNAGYTDDQRARAMVSMLTAFREDLLRPGGNGRGAVDTTECTTGSGGILSG